MEEQETAGKGKVNDQMEGYPCPKVGDLLTKRYTVSKKVGKGVFGCVLLAKDISNQPVAIKMMRTDLDIMKISAERELILESLNKADPKDEHHLLRLNDKFLYGGHLSLVYEVLDKNMREVLDERGFCIGLRLREVHRYAR